MSLIEAEDRKQAGTLTIEDERLSFWLDKVMTRIETGKLSPHCLERQNPVKAANILMMLEERISEIKIQKALGCNNHTTRRLRVDFSETIQERRKEFSRRFAVVSEMATDLLMKKMGMLDGDDEMLANTPLKDLALVAAIATDKGGMLDGMPTVTIEHRKGSSIEDALKLRDAARQRLTQTQVIEAEILP